MRSSDIWRLHVAADCIDRDMSVAEHHTRQGLGLDIAHGFALRCREAANLRLREVDVLDLARRKLPDGSLDLRVCELEFGGLPLIEFRDNSRASTSPCFSMFPKIFSAVARTIASASATATASLPGFKYRMVTL